MYQKSPSIGHREQHTELEENGQGHLIERKKWNKKQHSLS